MHSMPKTKYNWRDLKRDFFTSDFNEVKSFLGDRKVAYNSRTRVNTKGWLEEKVKYQKEVNERALETFKVEKSTILAEGLKTVTLLIIQELKKYQTSPDINLDPRQLHALWKMLRVESGLYTEVPYKAVDKYALDPVTEEESFNRLMGYYNNESKKSKCKETLSS